MEINPALLVHVLKWRIEQLTGLPAARMRLIVGRAILYDIRSLAEYGVKHGDIIRSTCG